MAVNLHITRWNRRLLSLAGLLLLLAVPALAVLISEKYYYEVKRGNETSLTAHLNLALGNIEIGKTERGYLFQGQVELEYEHMKPRFQYEVVSGKGTLLLDLENEERNRRGLSIRGLSSVRSSQWILNFGNEVPLDIKIEMGVARGDINLTGLPIQRFEMDCGVSNTRLQFGAANPIAMEHLRVKAGASEFSATGLGFSRAKRISFDGGTGRFNLDFTGDALPEGARADISIGMASLVVSLPENRPIILRVPESWLTRIDIPVNYTKKGNGVWHSSTVRDESRAFTLNVSAGMGNVRFQNAGVASR